MELREFRTKQFILLKQIEKELLQKYPEKRERIQYIADVIASKLDHLRTFTLYDYLRTIDLASKEFPEFEKLFPDPSEIEQLLGEEK